MSGTSIEEMSNGQHKQYSAAAAVAAAYAYASKYVHVANHPQIHPAYMNPDETVEPNFHLRDCPRDYSPTSILPSYFGFQSNFPTLWSDKLTQSRPPNHQIPISRIPLLNQRYQSAGMNIDCPLKSEAHGFQPTLEHVDNSKASGFPHFIQYTNPTRTHSNVSTETERMEQPNDHQTKTSANKPEKEEEEREREEKQMEPKWPDSTPDYPGTDQRELNTISLKKVLYPCAHG